MTPYRLTTTSQELPQALTLIQRSFAYMDGRIDPPSSMHRLTLESLSRLAEQDQLWVIGSTPVACVLLSVRPDALYLGKLAVDNAHRGRGLARQLIELAALEARRRKLSWLELQTRVELTENHATFQRMGFVQIQETAHPGYSRPTSITMRRQV